MYPSRFEFLGQNVTSRILGFDLLAESLVEANVTFKKSLNTDVNGRVPIHEGGEDDYSSSDVIIMIDYEFTERKYIISYFGYMDILSKIGGIAASISPVLGMIAPAFILFYLHSLSQVIIRKHKAKFKDEVLKIYQDYKQFLVNTNYLDEENELFDSESKRTEIKKFLSMNQEEQDGMPCDKMLASL